MKTLTKLLGGTCLPGIGIGTGSTPVSSPLRSLQASPDIHTHLRLNGHFALRRPLSPIVPLPSPSNSDHGGGPGSGFPRFKFDSDDLSNPCHPYWDVPHTRREPHPFQSTHDETFNSRPINME